MNRIWEVGMDDFKGILKDVELKLQEAEDRLRNNGINLPDRNITLTPREKISVPKKYIRKASHFKNSYKLNELVKDSNLQSNLAYAIQFTDLLNYFLNRFDLALSAGAIFYKNAMVHVVSCIEGLIFCSMITLNEHCKKGDQYCNKHRDCEYYIKSCKNLSFKKSIELLKEKELLSLTDEQLEEIKEIKSLRDKVHIHLTTYNEYLQKTYDLENYNKCIRNLKLLSEDLAKCYNEFCTKRDRNCLYGI